MILTNLEDSVWVLFRRLFYRRTKALNPDEREGLRQAVRNIISHRLLLVGMLFTGLLAAVFEGGSLGILGLSVGIITGEASDFLAQFPSWAGEYLDSMRNRFGAEKTFLLLVGIAIGAQILKSILTFVSTATHITLLVPRFEPVGHLFNACYNSEEIGKGTGLIQHVSYGIEFRDVCFSYPNSDRLTLEKLNLFLPKGKSIAFVGESGSGKSTIVNLLLGLYQPTSGGIFVDGHDLKTLDMFEWRCKLGVVDQEVFLLNSSVLDNIRFGRDDFSLSDVDAAAGTAHARDFISRFEQGYDTVIGDRGYKLSGGQKQRIALARALLGDPEILILDEATSALDSLSEKNIQQTIEELRGSRTVITIAHRLGTISRADNVVVIENGRVVEEGTKEELLSKEGKFHALSVA